MSTGPPKLLPALDDRALSSAIESILLVTAGPVMVSTLAKVLEAPRHRVVTALAEIGDRQDGGVRLQMHGGEAQLVTAPENSEWVHRFLGVARPAALSRGSLETLAVIAYQQPITRGEIEAARGVNSDRAVQTLLARNLIEACGRRETLGRPMQYGTGFGFLEYFGLRSLEDLAQVDRGDERAVEPGVLGMLPTVSPRGGVEYSEQ